MDGMSLRDYFCGQKRIGSGVAGSGHGSRIDLALNGISRCGQIATPESEPLPRWVA